MSLRLLRSFGFVNYHAYPTRWTPLNLAVARVILGSYLIWKTMWYDWRVIAATPFRVEEGYLWAIPPASVLVVEKYLLIVTLLLFVVGYRLRLTAFLSSLLVAHLATVRFSLYLGGMTTALFIAAYALLFFGLYARQDKLSVDSLRRATTQSPVELRDHLTRPLAMAFRADPLRLLLLALGVIYFGSGVDKLRAGGLAWFDSVHLTRVLVTRTAFYGYDLGLGKLLVDVPAIAILSSWGTLAVELGILIAVLIGAPVTIPMFVLLGFMILIPVTMGILFADVLFFIAMLFAWDRLDRALSPAAGVDLVFDDHCLLCMRSLHLFKYLDADARVRFYPQSEAPATYTNLEGVDFERSMYVFDGDHAYEGYWAFRALFAQFGLLRPVAWLMGRSPVAFVGTRIYRYVADNRSRHFACAVDFDAAD